jgi:hypothetical protein
VLSLFDKLWHPDLTEAEALELMKKGAVVFFTLRARGQLVCMSRMLNHVSHDAPWNCRHSRSEKAPGRGAACVCCQGGRQGWDADSRVMIQLYF